MLDITEVRSKFDLLTGIKGTKVCKNGKDLFIDSGLRYTDRKECCADASYDGAIVPKFGLHVANWLLYDTVCVDGMTDDTGKGPLWGYWMPVEGIK